MLLIKQSKYEATWLIFSLKNYSAAATLQRFLKDNNKYHLFLRPFLKTHWLLGTLFYKLFTNIDSRWHKLMQSIKQ